MRNITTFRRSAAFLTCILLFGAPQFAAAQDSTARAVVQPLPSPEVQRLNRALMELARRPNRVNALLEAGDASLAVEDHDAAIGFYGRASEMSANDPRVKLGIARVYLRTGRPVEAIPLLNSARTSGASARDVLSDQALAFDLIGDQQSAQATYLRAIELDPQDDEARRRLGLSYAISGNEGGFQSTLAPLIEARDLAAFRARAFGLAIMGEQRRAEAIVDEVMPPDLATRINPYLAYMPRLTPSQQAAAANLGIFPRAADIGRENPRIARFAREGAAGSRLEPAGEPLGTAPDPVINTVSQEVVQAAPEPAAPEPVPAAIELPPVVVAMAEPEPVPAARESQALAEPGLDLSRTGGLAEQSAELPDIATAQVAEVALPTPPTPRTPEPESASVADAFADFGEGELPVARATGDAVDLAVIEIRRDPVPQAVAEPEEPAHPRRIWVQLATGRDVDALAYDWRRFARRAPDLLGEFEPHVTPWGQANRLLAGPIDSRADARALVRDLAAKGVETFSYTSPEGTEIQRVR